MTGNAGEMELDLAIIGGGVAGTSVACAAQQVRPDWSISVFERTGRIGGRLRSVRVDGLDYPIELGGMRYITSHVRFARLVDQFALSTHPFDPNARDRSYLRGVTSAGADDPEAGRGYGLAAPNRGRSADDLLRQAFERIVPGFAGLDHDGYAGRRATDRFLGRRLTDWPIGDALEAALGREERLFVTDSFGYDSGIRAFNAPDFVEFMSVGGDPSDEARTPDDGMDRIPRELAARFEAGGGAIHLDRGLESLTMEDGATVLLRLGDGSLARAARVVLATPLPALRLLASTSAVLRRPAFERVFDSVEGFPAMKLYLWYERPWWRPAVSGNRTTTDLALRKVFYFDGAAGSRSALLAMFTDGLHVQPWEALYDGSPSGAPASLAMLAEVTRLLRETHPDVREIPPPVGSAFMYWGADPHEVAWHFWRAGEVSDEILRLAPQPDNALPVYIANEAFSRRQSWAEGALEAAEAVVERLTA